MDYVDLHLLLQSMQIFFGRHENLRSMAPDIDCRITKTGWIGGDRRAWVRKTGRDPANIRCAREAYVTKDRC